MIVTLAHLTPHEFPLGVALFLGGIGVGIGVGIYLRYFRAE